MLQTQFLKLAMKTNILLKHRPAGPSAPNKISVESALDTRQVAVHSTSVVDFSQKPTEHLRKIKLKHL